MTTKQQTFTIIIVIAALALLFGMWVHHNTKEQSFKATTETATIFNHPRIIAPFDLTDDKGQPFTLDNLKGHWSLIFFGFTNCPDLCPTTLSTLNEAYQKLESEDQSPMPQIVFISVDPQRDNSQRILDYLENFNSAFLGATGEKASLDGLTQGLSVLYAKITQEDHYTIDHSGTIVITNPEGQFYGVFTLPHDANNIADDMALIIQ